MSLDLLQDFFFLEQAGELGINILRRITSGSLAYIAIILLPMDLNVMLVISVPDLWGNP